MSELTYNKIEYLVALIAEFAKKYNLSTTQAYRYIKTYDGVSFINKCYNVMHLQSFNHSVEDMATYCRNRGGNL